MAKDTAYKAFPLVFRSKGLFARHVTDRPPDASYFQNMTGCFEREEEGISTRYGSTIINRDPDGTPNGANFPFSAAPVTISRLRSLNGATFRYTSLADGTLWRRAGDTQGPFSQIASGLSGQPATMLVTNCFGAAQPFEFVYDRSKLLKDSGTGTPTRNGIFPPTQPAIATQYAPQILTIDTFGSTTGYSPSSMTAVSVTTAFTVAATDGNPILNGDYEQYTDLTGSYTGPPDGMIAISTGLADGAYRLKFNTFPVNNTFDIVALNQDYSPSGADSFVFTQSTWSVAANTTGYIGKSVALDLSKYQGDDLIVIALRVSNPECIQEIRVLFDVDSSGYTSSYYYKSIIPVSYQGNLSLPQTNDPASAMTAAAFDSAMGITNWSEKIIGPRQDSGDRPFYNNQYPSVPQGMAGTQPSQMSSGQGSWSVIYLPKGQFQPAGNAGESGADWSKITGWRVQVTTNSQGSSNISFNGLYIQGSPTATGVGTNAGPSSYGGVGYDFRYTYFDATTITESNGCRQAYFSVTPTNPGGQSLLVLLRQAVDLLLQYSPDPQVTHVRIYARGGVFGNNWFYADQVPNVTGAAQFHYQYILPDSALSQGNILSLTNDVPVTSTLQKPISTTLTNPIGPIPVNTNTPTLQTVTVDDPTATFVPFQIVDIGGPQDLEQVFVVTGGTGSFTAYIQLPHGGTNVPVSAVVTSGTNSGTGTWVNPGFITSADGQFSTVKVAGVAGSLVSSPGYLQGQGCGFAEPSTTTIEGIQVDIQGFSTSLVSPTAGISVTGNVWTNLSNAYDGNFVTFASGHDSQALATPTEAIWSGFPAITSPTALPLNIRLHTVNSANTPGSFLVSYSLDNGATWHVFPGTPFNGTTAATTYTVNLPIGQDTTKVQVKTDAEWISGLPPVIMDVYEIWISPPFTNPGQFALQLMKAGINVGNVETKPSPTVSTLITFGGPSDLWGTTWASADVNSPTFGAAIQAQIDNATENLLFSVDYVKVTVYGAGGGFVGEPVQAFSTPGQPLYLAALAYGQVYMAGDPNNPHYLYFTPVNLPQYCPPQNYIPVGSPTDPISAVINYRGTLFVRTFSTWYQIFPGNPPYAQSTGSKHGSPANFDWCLTESEIWYQSWDGIRTFRGADGKYQSLIIEWLYRGTAQTPVSLVDLSKLGSVISAFKNNTATFAYIGQDQQRHRLRFSTQYQRWRNDDVPATAIFTEPDTNLLVYAIPDLVEPGWLLVYEDITKDYDDGGWFEGALLQNVVPMNLQLPYIDLGALNNQKNFNTLTVDANPNNQTLDVQLLFDDNNGAVAPIDLGTFTGATRQKFQFIINGGLGQQAYKVSPKFTAGVTAAPILYQADIYAAILPDQRTSYDSYLQKFGTDESKLVKQGYFDVTSTTDIVVQLFADGSPIPYYIFTIPANPVRSEMPTRVRFPAMKLRLFRLVMTSTGIFQLWSAVQVDQKMVIGPGAKGYQRSELTGLTP